ncbi:amylo-alpha-1,6-glucosidase [Sorangium sp. wiwo2]|uniref:Amylo-alpha-1,6-glucosidase n=2 Tax=Sorangium atrum TaxID=2995308 RepID=A0ABT5CEU6_9BACT|nr:amylo-alpha-1,6-glucosidase [Sorangium aterium]MDC0684984.1 amylo-alpha-1,6-glucosidase [Sorangium aterium]
MGREICGDLGIAEEREWLVTNGIGGYGSGTVAGSLTRGYHGLLVAALRPPVDRRLMLVKLDETVTYRGAAWDLATNRWASGAVAPGGFVNIEHFALDGSIPCWRYACADALLEKRIWMEHGQNTTYIAYTALRAREPLRFTARAIANNRVFHNTGTVAWPAGVSAASGGVRVVTAGDALPLFLKLEGSAATPATELYRGFALPAETARGLLDRDDHIHVATFETTLLPGETVVFLAAAGDGTTAVEPEALARRRARDRALLSAWSGARPSGAAAAPGWVAQLVLAADQFVVDRAQSPGGSPGKSPGGSPGKSIIAGYPWFEDWGRDTMISLPGLALSTGQASIAAPILRTFAAFVDQGMLPNRFPDGATVPEYNTMDATLWYFQAIRACHEATGDDGLLRDLFPVLQDIIDWHIKGTRYGIHVDPGDGLLRGGQEGVQLTWMDAKVGDRVITPRIGKPVEINALWYNALRAMVAFAARLGEPAEPYQGMAARALASFDRFWNAAADYCYDVLDGPSGAEAALRPNQLFAVSLPESPLSPERQRAVVDACARALLTSHGLRSLAPSEPAYQGVCVGDQERRDASYHQGTVWAWLIGPFIEAHLRVYRDPDAARRLLAPMGDHINAAGLGSISEIFDGDAPFVPRGCIAQAWSVGEALRAFTLLDQAASPVQAPA